jgi:hypothetical protein
VKKYLTAFSAAMAMLAMMLQVAQAQATASDGLIHITCTFPSMPPYPYAQVEQIIIDPAKDLAWTTRGCTTSEIVVPATILQGTIGFEVRCPIINGVSPAWREVIDRYTGTILESYPTEETAVPRSGECKVSQRQQF